MDQSIFLDKTKTPTDKDLELALGHTYAVWHLFRDYLFAKLPEATDEWNSPGKKYGWSYRIKFKKRTIIYLLPRDGYFKVAFVFGQKAVDKIVDSHVKAEIIKELQDARLYAEGRGIRVAIKDSTLINDIKELIDIKLAN
jgi:hypothetical protein